jgi:hypothetical protein
LLIFELLLVPLFFGACQAERKTGEAASLEERVRAFWDARIAGDDLNAYRYEAYAKTGKMTSEQYVRARNPALRYKAYEMKKIEENGDNATVAIDLQYHLILPARGDLDLSMQVREQWVRLDDGQWYRQLQESKLPFGRSKEEKSSPQS